MTNQTYLLHSMTCFEDLLVRIFEVVSPSRIVEIGAETGGFSRRTLEWADQRGSRMVSIDPAPEQGVVDLFRQFPAHRLVLGKSLAALPLLEAAQLYLVDGDHNYYTVRRELEIIEEKVRESPAAALTVLHDVGWPCGRRDFYYCPDDIPSAHRHPFVWERGVTLGNDGTVPFGFRGQGHFAVACRAGGPANGVLTAVEDFMSERPRYILKVVPSVFGLGFLYGSDAPWRSEVESVLAPYVGSPFLERLEVNRLELYLRVLELEPLAFAEPTVRLKRAVKDLLWRAPILRAWYRRREARLQATNALPTP